MNKVEFKYVKNNEEAKKAFDMYIAPKNAFVVTLEEGHLCFNGINLSKQYNISDDKVIKDIVKEDDKLVISFTDDSENKIIDISKHLNNVKKGYELQNILATDFINIKDQYQSVEELKDADLNNLKDINTYYISEINIENIKNLPEEFNDECYLYILNTKENEVSQLIKSINTGDKYIRYCKNDEWFPWSKELGKVIADKLKGLIRLTGDIEGEASFIEGVTTVNTKSSKLVSRYEIVRGDDLNNLTKTGMYGSDGQVFIKNKPSNEVNYFTLNVINRQNQEESTACSQQLTDTETNNIWTRTKHTNGWSEWKNLSEGADNYLYLEKPNNDYYYVALNELNDLIDYKGDIIKLDILGESTNVAKVKMGEYIMLDPKKQIKLEILIHIDHVKDLEGLWSNEDFIKPHIKNLEPIKYNRIESFLNKNSVRANHGYQNHLFRIQDDYSVAH